MNAPAFRRIYIDLPGDVDDKLAKMAADAGQSKKGFVASLIIKAASDKRSVKKEMK